MYTHTLIYMKEKKLHIFCFLAALTSACYAYKLRHPLYLFVRIFDGKIQHSRAFLSYKNLEHHKFHKYLYFLITYDFFSYNQDVVAATLLGYSYYFRCYVCICTIGIGGMVRLEEETISNSIQACWFWFCCGWARTPAFTERIEVVWFFSSLSCTSDFVAVITMDLLDYESGRLRNLRGCGAFLAIMSDGICMSMSIAGFFLLK